MGIINETALILMLKNPETGFFEEELRRYCIGADEDLIEGLYAERTEDGLTVCLRVGIGNSWTNISDELFGIIYDDYDTDLLPDFVTEFIELDECYTPAWEARFLLSENPAETEDMIKQALTAHRKILSLLLDNAG
ncbi:MAG: hypothetical protein LBB94_06815 [Clostridiales bacterium]|nr:hypothetical protein [Clostridiales bacterium]